MKEQELIAREKLVQENEQEINASWERLKKRIAELDAQEKELNAYAREILERERAVTVREKAIQEAEKDIRIDSIFEKINSHSREARLADEPQQKPRGLNLSFIW